MHEYSPVQEDQILKNYITQSLEFLQQGFRFLKEAAYSHKKTLPLKFCREKTAGGCLKLK